jgi:hypothetical protein
MTDDANASELTPSGDEPSRAGDQAVVPRQRLDHEISRSRRLEHELAAIRQEVDGLKQASTAPRTYTHADLQTMVDNGQITEAQMRAQIDQQQREAVSTEVRETVTKTIDQQRRAERVQSELARYRDAMPGLLDDASPVRERARREMSYLMSHGLPDSAETEVAALRAAFGAIESVERSKRTDAGGSTHEEVGGGDRGGDDKSGGTGGWPKDMPARNRQYYEQKIAAGVYQDRDAALAEWNYRPKHSPNYRRSAA